ncbi:MAG: homoserine kinase [Alphaproteobacteria bacterium]
MAVYTEFSNEELDVFMRGYGLGEVRSIKGIAEGVENTNYLLVAEAGPYILTLYEKRVAKEDLPFFLGLMDHLAARGLSCPTPVHDNAGSALNRLAERPAAIVTFLDGVWVRRPTPDHCRAVGAALAAMHLAAEGFSLTRSNALGVSSWRPLFAQCGERADEVRPGLGTEIIDELALMEARWPDALPRGVIHADLFPDNVFFLHGELSGLIDFYFACNDMLAYDVAICLNAWCFEQDLSFNITKARALLTGYRSVRALDDREITALPLLARGAALRFMLTRLYDWLTVPAGALVVPKDPLEFYKRLRFHRTVDDATAYGIDL